jgi:hypothetical protein
MKNIIIVLLILFPCFNLYTQELQDNAKAAAIIDIGEIESGGYGAFEVRMSNIKINDNTSSAVFVGARGGWIINSTLSIGGGGYGMVSKYTLDHYQSEIAFDNATWELPTLQLGYGGFFMEYTHNSDELLHFTVNTLIGAGGANYVSNSKIKTANYEEEETLQHENSAFFVLEPGITAELNIVSFFRISAGLSYRYVSGVNLSNTVDADLRGLSYTIAFKFGKF